MVSSKGATDHLGLASKSYCTDELQKDEEVYFSCDIIEKIYGKIYGSTKKDIQMMITDKNMFLIELDKKGILSKSKFRHLQLTELRGITTSRDKEVGKGGGFIIHPAVQVAAYRLKAHNEELLAEIVQALKDKMGSALALYGVDGDLKKVKDVPASQFRIAEEEGLGKRPPQKKVEDPAPSKPVAPKPSKGI